MRRPAEFHFALDVDDLAGAGPHAAGDAGRSTERVTAEHHDAQAVDLADLAPCVSISAISRRIIDLAELANARDARGSAARSRVHIGSRATLPSGDAAQKSTSVNSSRISSTRSVSLLPIVGDARGMLDHPRDGGAIERFRPSLPCHAADHAGEQHLVLGRSLQVILEIGEHLEMPRQFGIEGAEHDTAADRRTE